MVFLHIIKEIRNLLENKEEFHILVHGDELVVVKKATSSSESVQSAIVFFQTALSELKIMHIVKALPIRDQILELHKSWFALFAVKKQSLSDRLCYLVMLQEQLQFCGKLSLGDWLNFQEKALFEQNGTLFQALNTRYDLGPFLTVEFSCKALVFVPFYDLQRRSQYAKNGKLSGFDFYYKDNLVVGFDKNAHLKKEFVVSEGAIRRLK